MTRLAVLGPLNVDLIVHGTPPSGPPAEWVGTSRVTVCMAGAVGYFIEAARALGHGVTAISTVGDDPLGQVVTGALDKAGVDRTLVEVQPGTTTAIAIYTLLFGSKKRPLTYQLPSHDLWPVDFTGEHASAIEKAGWFHHGGYLHFPKAWAGPVHEAFRHAKSAGKMTSLDPQFPLEPYPVPWLRAMDGLLGLVDVLFVDALEACNLTGAANVDEAGHKLLEAGPSTVVVKQGELGATAFAEGRAFNCPALHVEDDDIVDSIGAGDTFDAGFVDALSRGEDVEAAMSRATMVAASTLRAPGGKVSLPG